MKKKILLFGPLVVLAVLTAAFLYVRSAYPPERLLALLEPRVEAALGREVTIGAARMTPLPLAVRLDDVRVQGGARESGDATLLELAGLRFELQWLPLLRREIAVRSLVLESPRVFLERNSEGRWNHESSSPESTAQGGTRGGARQTPLGLRIESLRVRDATLHLLDRQNDVEIHVPLEAELTVRSDRSLQNVQVRGWLQSDAVSGGESGSLQAIRDVRLRVEPDIHANLPDSSAVVQNLRVELQDLVLDLEGRAALQNGQPSLSLQTRTNEFELQHILSLIPKAMAPALADVQARGIGKLSLRIEQDPGAAPRLVGHLELRDGVLEHPQWPTPVQGLHAELDWAESLLMISRIEARAAGSPIRIHGQVHEALDPKAATYDLDVQAALDLAALSPMLPTPPGVELAGQVGVGVHARGGLEPGKLPQITGPITLQDVRVRTPELATALGLDATLEAKGDVIRIERGTLTAADQRVALEGDIALALPPEKPRVTLRGSATRFDLDALQPSAGDANAGSTSASQSANTAGKAQLVPELPPAHLDIALRADELVVQQAEVRGARLQLRGDDESFELTLRGESLQRETLRLTGLEAELQGDAATAQGTLRAENGQLGHARVSALRGDMSIVGTRVEITNLNGRAYEGAVRGHATLDLADPDAPRQEVDLRLEDVQLGGLLGDLWSAGGLIAGDLSGSTSLLLVGKDPLAIRRTMTAEGQGIAVNGRVRELPFLSQIGDWLQLPSLKNFNYRELGFDFKVDAGRARFPRLQMLSQDAAVGVLGSIGLDGSLDLDVNVQLSEAATRRALEGALAGRVGSLFTDSQGHLVFDFDVRGRFNAPQLHPNFERTAARGGLKSLAQQDIQRLLGRLTGGLGTPPAEDTRGKLEDAVQSGVKDALGNIFGKKKKPATAAPDSTPKP